MLCSGRHHYRRYKCCIERGLDGTKQIYKKQKFKIEGLISFLAFGRYAPVQINTWGHSDTSGIPTIDRLLCPTAGSRCRTMQRPRRLWAYVRVCSSASASTSSSASRSRSTNGTSWWTAYRLKEFSLTCNFTIDGKNHINDWKKKESFILFRLSRSLLQIILDAL